MDLCVVICNLIQRPRACIMLCVLKVTGGPVSTSKHWNYILPESPECSTPGVITRYTGIPVYPTFGEQLCMTLSFLLHLWMEWLESVWPLYICEGYPLADEAGNGKPQMLKPAVASNSWWSSVNLPQGRKTPTRSRTRRNYIFYWDSAVVNS